MHAWNSLHSIVGERGAPCQWSGSCVDHSPNLPHHSPCISTGVYGYPNAAAAHVALSTIKEWLANNNGHVFERIVFCVFLDVDRELYRRFLPTYFPSGEKAEMGAAVNT